MKYRNFFGILLVFAMSTTIANASRIRLRPLTGKEVYKLLKEAGREDAIPEGRIVTQGLSAASGFVLGLKKGIAIPLAVGAASSNISQEFLNSLNYTAFTLNNLNYSALTSSLPTFTLPTFTLPTFNVTALTGSLPTFNIDSLTSAIPTFNVTAFSSLFQSGSKPTLQYISEEICFNTRAANEIDDDDDDDDGDGRDYGDGDADADGAGAGEANDADYDDGDVVRLGRQVTATTLTSPTTTGSATGTVTTSNTGDGTATNTQTTTQTADGSVNCIVIQKPVLTQ